MPAFSFSSMTLRLNDAQLIRVTRNTLNRALRDFAEAGCLTSGYMRVTLTDRDALQRIVEEP